MWIVLLLALGGAPENADAIRAGVKAAKPALEKCEGNSDCFCAALKKVRFDITLDGGTLVVTYPLVGPTGPSFTLDASGRVIDCKPGNQK
jgi:hypothetical protein